MKRPLPIVLTLIIAVVALLVLSIFQIGGSTANAAQSPVGLGTAGNFAVLAGSTITNTGSTTITGDVGLHPGSAVTGFNSVTLNGSLHVADAVAQQAKVDLLTAYNDAAGRGPVTTVATELGGQILIPGVYGSASGTFQITGALTLDGQGDPNAVFVFKMATTLVTATVSSVNMINSANFCNVFWQVGSSATLGTGTQFKGNILAQESITLVTGSRIDGRALAETSAVTMDTNTITQGTCAAVPPTPTPTVTPTTTATPTPTATGTATPTSTATATPTGTPTSTSTATAAPTATPTSTSTATGTPTATPTDTPSPTPTDSSTPVLVPQENVPPVTGFPATGGPPLAGFPWLLVLAGAIVGSFALIGLGFGARTLRRRHAGSLGGMIVRGLLFAALIVATSPAYGHIPAVRSDSVTNQTQATTTAAAPAMEETRDFHFETAFRAPAPLAPLFRPGLDLRAPPVGVPLQLRIPALHIGAAVLGVGLTSSNVMDAPNGAAAWQKAFWYRGGAIPGNAGTATIAGHVSGGRDSLFAHLDALRKGDLIIIHDSRGGGDARFTVTDIRTYSNNQLSDASVLARIYGAGPVSGKTSHGSADGVSRLTLVTCAGEYVESTYDQRLAIFAERTN